MCVNWDNAYSISVTQKDEDATIFYFEIYKDNNLAMDIDCNPGGFTETMCEPTQYESRAEAIKAAHDIVFDWMFDNEYFDNYELELEPGLIQEMETLDTDWVKWLRTWSAMAY